MTVIHRVEVRPKSGQSDPRGEAVLRQADASGLPKPASAAHASVYLIEGTLDAALAQRIAQELLADPVTQEALLTPAGAVPAPVRGQSLAEIHALAGVTDPAAESVESAVSTLFGVQVRVRSGDRYDFAGLNPEETRLFAERALANTVIQEVHPRPFHPVSFPTGHSYTLAVRSIPIASLSDAQLEKLSREAHLFLSLPEMQAIQAEYQRLGREPREIELETLAQTWSEHCVHKTLKSTVRYREANLAAGQRSMLHGADTRPGHSVANGELTVRNLLKSTVAAGTFHLMDPSRAGHIDWCLSVFVDNSGVIAFDEQHAVCFKVETHNRPSAIEPYGGAATGIGGCIRDVMGTGMGAKPIASTDVFCVAPLDMKAIPPGCLPPRRILTQVVGGVRDYGNRMGIPTVNGAVWFDERYVGNPLVYCGVVGTMPRSMVKGHVLRGDRIVAIGGRTGRDGIHGATFSSAEVEHGHSTEFSHAVQIGNAITEKRMLDALLAARDHAQGPLYSGLTDCGAGGFSSAVGEMGRELGATVHLDRAPVKYDGLSPTEVWISEAQERMVLAVPADKLPMLRSVCAAFGVEHCELGEFGTPDGTIRLLWHGTEVGSLDTHFLHDGVPMPVREAVWDAMWSANNAPPVGDGAGVGPRLVDTLQSLLAHPNLASKAWIIRQYDHEVQGGSVVKPLVGPGAGGPGDAAVVRPIPESDRALAIGNGLCTGWASDPYAMTLAALDECVRNLVCVGADPSRIAVLDNFCWPSCEEPRNMGALVRAAEACYDGALAYGTPFISGKDSLKNQFRTQDGRVIMIPPTLLISGFGIVRNAERACTMDAKATGNLLVLVGTTGAHFGGSHRAMLGSCKHATRDARLPTVDPVRGAKTARAVADCIQQGLVRSAHDPSEGGLLPAVAEMCFAGELGAAIDLAHVPVEGGVASMPSAMLADEFRAFAEDPHRYLLEVEPAALGRVQVVLKDLPHAVIGTLESEPMLRVVGVHTPEERISVAELRKAWNASTGG